MDKIVLITTHAFLVSKRRESYLSAIRADTLPTTAQIDSLVKLGCLDSQKFYWVYDHREPVRVYKPSNGKDINYKCSRDGIASKKAILIALARSEIFAI